MSTPHFPVRILTALLKQYGVMQIVLSSGMRNIPFVNEVETDPDFLCYSVVDERNAAFFALGLSQQSGQPVAFACTSGTAASNYHSGMAEAYFSRAPLVAITFDRSPYTLNQMETQKIDQVNLFTSVCKKSVTLPIIKDEEDAWYYRRLINEALISLEQHGTGPVHINVPLTGNTNSFYCSDEKNPVQASRISYVPIDRTAQWEAQGKKLREAQKVLVVMGQMCSVDKQLGDSLRRFCHVIRAPLLADSLANFRCEELISSEAVIKALNAKTIAAVLPEIVMTVGCNFQERIKDLLKAHQGKFEHWSIEPDGMIKDVFRSETALFECTPEQFFSYYADFAEKQNARRDEGYLQCWRQIEEAISLPDMPFTNFYVVQEFCKAIPQNSILHLSILNATRMAQFFKLDESVTVYSNVNAFGIDGCLPTFMGQAASVDRLAFLITGDLSFFYGMNALGIVHRKNNIRILLINNGGGAEFYIRPDVKGMHTSDVYIGAVHSQNAKGWSESLGYLYLSANDAVSLQDALNRFIDPAQESPVLLEVFTDMKQDGQFLLSLYRHLEKCIKPVIERMCHE